MEQTGHIAQATAAALRPLLLSEWVRIWGTCIKERRSCLTIWAKRRILHIFEMKLSLQDKDIELYLPEVIYVAGGRCVWIKMLPAWHNLKHIDRKMLGGREETHKYILNHFFGKHNWAESNGI